MKNKGRHILLIAALFLIFFSSTAYGEELKIGEERIYVEILKDGNIKVKDDIVFDFSGSFNGVYKDISFDKAEGIRIKTVAEAIFPQKVNSDYMPYELKNDAENGEEKVYSLIEEEDKVRVKIFSPSEDTVKGFRISYDLKGAVKKYSDTGEFYWKFIGPENETDIRSLEIYLTLPEGATKDSIKAFGHGPLNGKVKLLDDRTVHFSVENLKSENYVEVRALFPSDLLSTMDYSSQEEKLPEILAEENTYLAKVDKKLKAKENFRRVGQVLPGIIIGISSLIGVFIYINLRKPRYNEYEKEVLSKDNYDPILLSYYAKPYSFNNGYGLMAQVFNLIKKKALFMIPGENEDDCKIIRGEEALELLSHERYLIDWLLEDMGNGSAVTLKEIKDYFKSGGEALSKGAKLTKLIAEETAKLPFISKRKVTIKIILVILSIVLLLLSILSIISGNLFGIAAIVIAAAVMIFSFFINTRTEEGQKAYDTFEDIRMKIIHYESLDLSELIEDMGRLEDYIVYSALFNYKDELVGAIRNSLGEDYDYSLLSNYYLWGAYYGMSSRGVAFGNSFDTSFNSYTESQSSSSSSSFSSGGGGFSSGGGGGAGGF